MRPTLNRKTAEVKRLTEIWDGAPGRGSGTAGWDGEVGRAGWGGGLGLSRRRAAARCFP